VQEPAPASPADPAVDKAPTDPEVVTKAMQPLGPVQEQVVTQSQSQTEPPAPAPLELVNAYKAEILEKTGVEISDAYIWIKSRYKTRCAFERRVRQDPKRPNKTADQVFRRLLTETKPHLK
jgi:hypothetical protein